MKALVNIIAIAFVLALVLEVAGIRHIYDIQAENKQLQIQLQYQIDSFKNRPDSLKLIP